MNMMLKKKLVLLLIISGATLILLFYTAFQFTMPPSLEDQKLIFIENLEKKIRMALSLEEENINLYCANWANWESMAHYVEDPSIEFESEVFPDMIFHEDIMDVVLVVKVAEVPSQEGILYHKFYKNKKFLSFEQMRIIGEIQRIKERIKQKPGVIKTILNTGAGPVMVVANPIFKGEQLKQLSGVLLLGRFINQNMLKRISLHTLEKIKTFAIDHQQVNAFYSHQMKKNDFFFQENRERLTIFYLLKDLYQQPAIILNMQTDNRLFRVVNKHFLAFVVTTVLSIILLGLLLYFSIQKYIILRMLKISQTMSKIEGLADLSKRIKGDHNQDEISHLISSINLMLDKLESEKVKREDAERTMITQGKLVSIGRLASCIGHEVNNPLMAISNSIQVMKKIGRSKSSLYKDALEICESEIVRIRDIISSLLDFHRLEKDEFTTLEVNGVVEKSLDVLKWSKKLGSVKIVRKMEENCLVYGSSAKLKQVFINFILNAVEAMEVEDQQPAKTAVNATDGADGTLQVEVKRSKEKDVVEIHFHDNGPGIPDTVKSHLFEPFVSTKESRGVGLGLYVSYKIIDLHKGEIIYNESDKKGTHFIIKLPAIKRCANGG
jgi:signal transduction histidine kinase